ncbi:MAG TPA: cupin domain-containing protein, partial [Chloroflexota bacterium]
WLGGNAKPEPRADVRPWLWRWADLRAALYRAAEVMPLGGDTERRALGMKNPTMPGGARGTTRTLVAAVQMIYPGEVAPSHRHTNAALRFIIEGSGAYTIVDGQPVSMDPGDFLITPSWAWHGHTHEGSGPMIWLDVLDSGLIGAMDWRFFEEYAEEKQLQPAQEPRDASVPRYASGGLLPLTRRRPGAPHSPLFNYKWPQTRAALDQLTDADASPFDGLALAYSDPATGAPVMPTIDCSIHKLPAGWHGKAHRHTTNTIYHVADGSGFSVIDGVRFDWQKSDTFCVPNWCWHEHAASPDGEAILFAASDLPVLEALHVYREEAVDSQQVVTEQFISS